MKGEIEKTDSPSPEKSEWLAFLKHEQLFKNQCIVIKAEDCSLGEQVLIYACAHWVSTGSVICFQTYVKYGGVLQKWLSTIITVLLSRQCTLITTSETHWETWLQQRRYMSSYRSSYHC